MEKRQFTVSDVARTLHQPEKKIQKMADSGALSGSKIQGKWFFSKADIVLWLERNLTDGKTDDYLDTMEEFAQDVEQIPTGDEEIVISQLLERGTILIPFTAKTKESVIRDLTKTGADLGLIWDPDRMADALRKREEMISTAMENGVALLHPRRPMPDNIADSFLLMGISLRGIPFGGGFNNLTDIFFLIGALDDKTHLQTLAGIGKILSSPDFLPTLRELGTPSEILDLIQSTEKKLSK